VFTHITGDIIQSVSESPPALLPIFRSRNQLRLLGYLFVHAETGISIAELERRTGIPQQTISREVDRLAEAGLLSVRSSGRRLVASNTGSPYFAELQALLLKAAGPAVLLSDALADVPGIREGHVFGSWARRYHGEPGLSPADVDVVVVGDADPDAVDAVCIEVGRRLGLEVNAVVLSDAEWEGRASGFLRQLREGPLVQVAPSQP
jgi:DNA-binding transcriptional ArsR family regulator